MEETETEVPDKVDMPEEQTSLPKEHTSLPEGTIEAIPISDLKTRLHEKIEMLKQKRETANPKKIQKVKSRKEKKQKQKKKERKNNTHISPSSGVKPSEKPLENSVTPEVSFSAFAFPEKTVTKKPTTTQLLKKTEIKQKKLLDLEKNDSEKLKSILENEKWSTAMKKSQGVKIKDDPKLLKKTLKLEEKKKKKSAKDWQDRINQQKLTTKRRIEKRNENLKNRKDAKQGKAKKKRPGFEGKMVKRK